MLNKIVSIKPEQPVFSKENLCSKPINPTFNEFAKGEMLERYPFNQYSTLGEVLATMSPKEVATLSEKLTLFLVQSINKFNDLNEHALMQMSVRLTPKEQVILTSLTHQSGWRHDSKMVEVHYNALVSYLNDLLHPKAEAELGTEVVGVVKTMDRIS